MLDIRTEGMTEVSNYLKTVEKKIKDRKSLFRAMGVFLVGAYQRNMTTGIDPEGRALKPVAIWTRIAGKGAGKRSGRQVPLLNTGSLRNSMQIVSIKTDELEVGWKGQKKTIAENMRDGKSGFMQVKTNGSKGLYSGIKMGRNGKQYIRVNNGGIWMTKRVYGDRVKVNPMARNFFYLGRKQASEVINMTDKWVEGIIE